MQGSAAIGPVGRTALSARDFRKYLWATSAVVLLLAAATGGVAQCISGSGPPSVDVLGAHDNGGRGCVACHALHNDLSNGEMAAGNAEWGNTLPQYGQQISFGEDGYVVTFIPTSLATATSEVSGVLLCLSCHDGNITAQNMLSVRSYEQKLGQFRNLGFSQPIPTLVGDELRARYSVDHPLGAEATIQVGNGLEFGNGVFSVTPRTPYARFVRNYGWPTLAPLNRSTPYGIDRQGKPYLLCTTCHDQHAMNVYASRPGSPIAGDGGKGRYLTFFYVNAPYNPTVNQTDRQSSTSNMQFCRQCHFDLSNESNNARNIRTVF